MLLSEASEVRETIVTLVHGTWARGAHWCKPDSKLCVSLKRVFGTNTAFDLFEWSGYNLHRARIVAGLRLADHILRVRAEHPKAQHFLIGHSHGGNVIRYALAREDVAKTVQGIATLATPFISAEPRAFGTWLAVLIRALGFHALLFSFLLVCGAVVYFAVKTDTLGFLNPSVMNVIAIPLIGAFFYGLRHLYAGPVGSHLARLQTRLVVRQAALLRQIDPPVISGLPLRSFSVQHDEPNFVMSAASAFGRTFFSPASAATILTALVLVVLPFLSMAGMAWLTNEPLKLIFGEGFVPSYLISLLIILIALPIVLFLYLIIALSGARLLHAPAFGEETFVENWILDVNETQYSADWQPCLNTEIRIPRRGWGWLHSRIYEDDEALTLLDEWMRSVGSAVDAIKVRRREFPEVLLMDVDNLLNSFVPPQFRDGGPIVRNISEPETRTDSIPDPNLPGADGNTGNRQDRLHNPVTLPYY